ncbi:hypothetical protein SADUNF_Sadunf14G0027700 [Salix dunnii]|uniref:Uncharacterized protein n=1 Tax=Salix dunnii TaxID=1413687 RepID=A0A835JHX2_9ROSI|nr:hypothetical protein SADUNF_Sadunf14G0027700 [Salix dunnii]
MRPPSLSVLNSSPMSSRQTVPHQQPEIRKLKLLVGLHNNKKPTGNATHDAEGSLAIMICKKKTKRVSTTKEIKKQSFPISLKKEEIVLDFVLLTGVKSKRKPQKRDKNVQAKLDSMFPGLRYFKDKTCFPVLYLLCNEKHHGVVMCSFPSSLLRALIRIRVTAAA